MVHLVTAVIKPHRLEDVKEALRGAGVQTVTVARPACEFLRPGQERFKSARPDSREGHP